MKNKIHLRVADFVPPPPVEKGCGNFWSGKARNEIRKAAEKICARTSWVHRETAVRKTLYFITWITRLLTSRSRLNVTSFYVLCKIVQMSLQESGVVLKGLPFVLFPIVLVYDYRGEVQPTEKSISNMLRGRRSYVYGSSYNCILCCIIHYMCTRAVGQ